MNDFTKAFEDMLIFGTGIIETKANSIAQIPIQEVIKPSCDHEPSDKYPNKFKWQLCHKCGEDYKC